MFQGYPVCNAPTQFRIEQFTAVTREVVGNEGKSASGNLERYTGYPIIDDF